jgi:asparaginyl-tRNA synthetase
MQRTLVKEIFQNPSDFANKEVTVCGWTRTIRSSNAFGFIELNDGSYHTNIQVVFEEAFLGNYKEIAKQNVGTAFVVKGTLVLTPEAKQPFEIKAKEIEIEGA